MPKSLERLVLRMKTRVVVVRRAAETIPLSMRRLQLPVTGMLWVIG